MTNRKACLTSTFPFAIPSWPPPPDHLTTHQSCGQTSTFGVHRVPGQSPAQRLLPAHPSLTSKLMLHMAAPERPDHSAEQTLKIPTLEYKTMARDHPVRPDTPGRASRSSFSSIRENDSDLAQSFTSSKISSLTGSQEAVEDLSPQRQANMVETQFYRPVTRPDSKLLGYIAPADSFTGWKQINVRGKLASKSFGDLQALNFSWTSTPKMPRKKGTYPPGEAPIEKLPIELLSKPRWNLRLFASFLANIA